MKCRTSSARWKFARVPAKGRAGTERGGNALRVVDNAGKIRTVAGTGKPGPLKDGPALECPLNSPKYLWIEKNGKVLIADSSNHAIRRYDPSTKTLTTVAGTVDAQIQGY